MQNLNIFDKLIGSGRTAKVYDLDDKVIKTFNKDFDYKLILEEYNKTKFINTILDNSPKAYDIVLNKDQYAIIYDKVLGTPLIDKIMAKPNPIEYLFKMVELQKKINSNIVGNEINSYKDFLKKRTNNKELHGLIDKLPDGINLLHGDFHIDNLIVNTNGELQVIDYMDICKGPVIFDIANSYYLTTYSEMPADWDEQLKEQIRESRKVLANAYLDISGYKLEDIKPFVDILLKLDWQKY